MTMRPRRLVDHSVELDYSRRNTPRSVPGRTAGVGRLNLRKHAGRTRMRNRVGMPGDADSDPVCAMSGGTQNAQHEVVMKRTAAKRSRVSDVGLDDIDVRAGFDWATTAHWILMGGTPSGLTPESSPVVRSLGCAGLVDLRDAAEGWSEFRSRQQGSGSSGRVGRCSRPGGRVAGWVGGAPVGPVRWEEVGTGRVRSARPAVPGETEERRTGVR
jgi:hypothetical protein